MLYSHVYNFSSPLEETLTASDGDSGDDDDDDGSLETTLTASLLPINETYEYVINYSISDRNHSYIPYSKVNI